MSKFNNKFQFATSNLLKISCLAYVKIYVVYAIKRQLSVSVAQNLMRIDNDRSYCISRIQATICC